MRRYKIILCFLAFNFLCAAYAFGLIDNWYHYEQGMRNVAAKKYDQAQREFNYYLNHPEMHRHMFGVAHFGRGLMSLQMGSHDVAIEEFNLAVKNDLHPTVKVSDKAYMNIGNIHFQRKSYNDAVHAYLKAVESNPKNGVAHYYLGLSYFYIGEYEKAEKEAEEAKKLNVTFPALSEKLSERKNSQSSSTE